MSGGSTGRFSDLEELVNSSLDAVWSVDRDHRLRAFNVKFADEIRSTLGIELAVGLLITEQFDPEANEIWKRRYHRCFSGERFTVEDRYSIGGESVYVEITLIPVRGENSAIVAAAVVSRDVTERKRSEEEASRLAGRLQAVLDSAAELSSTIREPEVVYNETLETLGASFRFDSATVQLLDGEHLRVVATVGFDENSPVLGMEFPLTEEFPNYRVITSGHVLALGDVRTDYPHFQSASEEFDSGHIRSWLGLPLIDRGGVIGMITLDRVQYEPFESEDVQLATGLAHHAAVAITNARLYKDLQDANRNQQTLLRELHHRVKNNMQLVSSLLNVRMGMIPEESAREVLSEIRTQITALASVHDTIYRSPTLEKVDLSRYVAAVIRDIETGYLPGGRGIVVRYDCRREMHIHIDRAIPLGLLLSELLLNAIKHAFPSGRSGTIRVTLDEDEGWGVIEVIDDGVGFPGEGRKGSFGMMLIESLVSQINAEAAVATDPGTHWGVRFPLS